MKGSAYGEKNNERLGWGLRFLIKSAVIVATLGSVVIFVFANSIVRVFIDDVEIINYGTAMLRALIMSAPFVGVIFVLSNLFQAMGKGTQSMVLAVSRQGLIFIPVLAVMSSVAGLNVTIYAQAVTDVVTVVLAVGLFVFG